MEAKYAIIMLLVIAVATLININEADAAITQQCVTVNDYGYMKCIPGQASNTITVIGGGTMQPYMQCPQAASSCVLKDSAPLTYVDNNLRVCTTGQNCDSSPSNFGRLLNIGNAINPGEWFKTRYSVTTIDAIYGSASKLVECSSSSVCSSNIVLGSAGCMLSVGRPLYTVAGAIVPLQSMYTVPDNTVYLYQKSTSCEYIDICISDTDCAGLGQRTGAYNGQSVGYSISGTLLTIYGCALNIIQLPADRIGQTNLSMQSVSASSCGIEAQNTVDCDLFGSGCPGGSTCNDFGNLDFRCMPMGECSAPADCEGKQHAGCSGSWSCRSLACEWTCSIGPPSPPNILAGLSAIISGILDGLKNWLCVAVNVCW